MSSAQNRDGRAFDSENDRVSLLAGRRLLFIGVCSRHERC